MGSRGGKATIVKIAYFSPFWDKKTGIATYSERLVPELRLQMDVHCFDHHNRHAVNRIPLFHDFGVNPSILSTLPDYDTIVYNLGNNPHFHLELYKVMRVFPGVAILHDTVLYYLFAGLGTGGLFKQICLNYGSERGQEIVEIQEASPERDILQYREPEKYPLLKSVLDYATGIIVHSRKSAEAVRNAGFRKPIWVVPMPADPIGAGQITAAHQKALREKHEIAEHDLVIGIFGFIGPSKRLPVAFRALGRIKSTLNFKLLIVGEGDEISTLAAENNLTDRLIYTRFVQEGDFLPYLSLTNLLINLRYPSMGEASITLVQALTLGIPSIVTNDAWFAELPDNCVAKIGMGRQEVSDLETAILELATNETKRASMSEAARQFVGTVCHPRAVAIELKRILEAHVRETVHQKFTDLTDVSGGELDDSCAAMMTKTLNRILPAHLKNQTRVLGDSGDGAIAMGVTPQDVRWAYRIILGRNPENETVVQKSVGVFTTVAELRKALLSSPEYRANNPEGSGR